MRRFVIAAALACVATAAPAWARDGAPYVGIEAGVVQPSMLNLELRNANVSVSNAMRIKHKYGYDVDAIGGYDFGMFRVEGELGVKHASIRRASIDTGALVAVNAANVNTNIFRSDGRSNVCRRWSMPCSTSARRTRSTARSGSARASRALGTTWT